MVSKVLNAEAERRIVHKDLDSDVSIPFFRIDGCPDSVDAIKRPLDSQRTLPAPHPLDHHDPTVRVMRDLFVRYRKFPLHGSRAATSASDALYDIDRRHTTSDEKNRNKNGIHHVPASQNLLVRNI
jgi:hypothetical protein